MSSSALLQHIVHTPAKLTAVSRIRICMPKRPGANANTMTVLRHFVQRRLPIFKFHNDQLVVDIKRPAAVGSAATPGIALVRGQGHGDDTTQPRSTVPNRALCGEAARRSVGCETAPHVR